MNAIEALVYWLKQQLLLPLPGEEAHRKMMPEGRASYELVERQASHRAGAVVVLLYPDNDVIRVLFIKRTEYDGHHSGQVAFPGGRVERSDQSLMHTALREACEEVGICMGEQDVLGAMSELYIPVSHTMVYPFLVVLHYKPAFKIDTREVAYLIEASLDDLQNPDNCKTVQKIINGKQRTIPYYSVNDEVVWGATAMIVSELLCFLPK